MAHYGVKVQHAWLTTEAAVPGDERGSNEGQPLRQDCYLLLVG